MSDHTSGKLSFDLETRVWVPSFSTRIEAFECQDLNFQYQVLEDSFKCGVKIAHRRFSIDRVDCFGNSGF